MKMLKINTGENEEKCIVRMFIQVSNPSMVEDMLSS